MVTVIPVHTPVPDVWFQDPNLHTELVLTYIDEVLAFVSDNTISKLWQAKGKCLLPSIYSQLRLQMQRPPSRTRAEATNVEWHNPHLVTQESSHIAGIDPNGPKLFSALTDHSIYLPSIKHRRAQRSAP